MAAADSAIGPSVWDRSGDRFNVQFMKTALRSEKSHVLSPQMGPALAAILQTR